MKKLLGICGGMLAASLVAQAQINLSTSLSYSQNFDGLASSGPTVSWADGSTLPSWYARVATTAPSTYRVGTGADNNGALYSFGSAAAADRAMGSVGSSAASVVTYGVRFLNGTASSLDSITVSYTGEQWRNGGNTTAQPLVFAYQIASAGITDPLNAGTWTTVDALKFTSPVATATAAALDGNAVANRTILSSTFAITLDPSQEIFLRWYDINDTGNDHALAIDDLSVSFTATLVPEPSTFALAGLGLLAAGLFRRKS